jgi:hypothetical protein
MPRRSLPKPLPGTLPASHPIATAWADHFATLCMLAAAWRMVEAGEYPILRALTAALLRHRPAPVVRAAG